MVQDPHDVLREHWRTLSRSAASYAPLGAERDDLVQDIALAVLDAVPRFRGESGIKTYVLRIAHNVGLRHALRRRRRGEVPDTEHLDTAEDPEQLLARRRGSERLADAIRALPLGSRQVLALALEDMTHAEMAEVLGIRENAVAVRLTRARQALREKLGEAPRDEESMHG